MSDYLERIGQDKIEDREEIEQLTSRVRELAEENTVLVKTIQRDTLTSLRQLAASQLHAEQLLEALTTCVCAMQDYQAGIGITEMFDKGERLGRKALASPSDTSALDAYVAEKLAAEQLNNKLLRDALEAVIKVHGYESGIPVEALSLPASTEALDAYVIEKLKESKGE